MRDHAFLLLPLIGNACRITRTFDDITSPQEFVFFFAFMCFSAYRILLKILRVPANTFVFFSAKVRLRNPWGRVEWVGEFGKKAEQWTPRLRQLLEPGLTV